MEVFHLAVAEKLENVTQVDPKDSNQKANSKDPLLREQAPDLQSLGLHRASPYSSFCPRRAVVCGILGDGLGDV